MIDPPELAGPPAPVPTPPTAALRRLVESKTIQTADPKDPKTLAPAIRELTELIALEPTNSDFYLLRATLSCHAHAGVAEVIDDIDRSISLHPSSSSTAYDSLREHYSFKAKMEFDADRFDDSMRDLDRALSIDYDSADYVFNDGNTKPSTTRRPCEWTQADLLTLAQRVPSDYRPHLYLGLYLTFFKKFDVDSEYNDVFDEYQRAIELKPASPLPHFFIGKAYTAGGLGGLMSIKNAKCLDWVVPRTSDCLALDEARRTGVRSLTRAIALDPRFRSAYALRASGLLNLKEYRQAIRDFDMVLELGALDETARITYNDRGLAKAALGQYRAAILDFNQSIALGCNRSCGSYDNRADTYFKMHNYAKAIGDTSISIRHYLSDVVFLMNVDQFRRLYPEYDAVPDDVLCEKLRRLFFPAMPYASFAKQFLVEAKGWDSTVLPELYVKRGDAYAAMDQPAKANSEYNRVSRGFPQHAAIFFVQVNGKRVRSRK